MKNLILIKKSIQTWERLHGELGLLRIDFILGRRVDMRQDKLHLTNCGTQLTKCVSTWLSTLQCKPEGQMRVWGGEKLKRHFMTEGRSHLTGAVNVMLLFPGSNVTSCTFSIWAPSLIPTVGGLIQLGVSGGELLSWRRMSRWVFLHITPVELRELSEGLLSWISSSSNEGPAPAEDGGPADELLCLNTTVPGCVRLWAPFDLPWVPPWSTSKWMLATSCWMRTDTGIKHRRVSSTCRTAPECTEAAAGWNFNCVSCANTPMLRVTLWAESKK